MIPAKKSRPFNVFFHQFNKRFLKLHFRNIMLSKETNNEQGPHLFIVNHSTWWDSLILFHLNQTVIKRDSYVMMHESGIKQYPFFRKIGAFSVNRNNPKDIIKSLQYAKEKLTEGKVLWLFPQGDERHQEIRPLGFLPGAIHLVKNTKIPITPVCLYYTFTNERKPDVFIKLGNPIYYSDLIGGNGKEKTLLWKRFSQTT